MRKKSEKAKQWAKADALWRVIVKSRAKGICEWCGKQGRDCHHMIGRTGKVLRCNPSNGVFLCVSCHFHFHNKDAQHGWDLFKQTRKKDYKIVDTLRNKTLKDYPIDIEELVEKLTVIANECN